MHSEYKAKLNQIRNIYNEELEKWVKEWNLDRPHCDVQVRCRLPRVHDSRDELAERAVADEADHPEGDREDGEDHQQEVQHHPDAAQTIRLRVRDGAEVQVPWRQEVSRI